MAQENIVALSEHVYYLPGGVNMALAVGPEREAVLIDTGQGKSDGKRLRKACEALGVRPVAILNTHAHADHYGGNDYLTRNLELSVYAPPFEASIMASPYLEPVYLFGGAKPIEELCSKWLLAKTSTVDHLLEAGTLELAGLPLTLIDTSGHAHRQLSVLVGDVLIAADALFGESVLERYPLPFGQDIGNQIASAEKLKDLAARVVLPGHGEPSEDLRALADSNLEAFEHAAHAVAQSSQDASTETVLTRTCKMLGIEIQDLPRYYLNLCTVMGYLTHLRESGRVELGLRDTQLRWCNKS